MPIVQEVISRQQAAKMMGISPNTVSQYKTSGAISGPVPGLFYTASVLAYLDRRNSGERRIGKPVRELAQDEKRTNRK